MIPSGEPTRVIFGNIAYGWLVYIFAVAMAAALVGAASGTTASGGKGKGTSRFDRPWERVRLFSAMALAISA